jgi:hypothetical protein
MAEEALTERRRNRGWFRKDQPLPYDPTAHEPSPSDNYHPDPLAYTDGGGYGKSTEETP